MNIKLRNSSLPISVYRGDTFNLYCIIDLDHNPIEESHYKLIQNDKLYIGIIEGNKLFEDAIVKKIATSETTMSEDNDPIIRFESIDTEYLTPGQYYIVGKLLQDNTVDGVTTNEITTVIQPVVFNIR